MPISDGDNSAYSTTTTGGRIYGPLVASVFKILIDLA
jgi:hypothetical protein